MMLSSGVWMGGQSSRNPSAFYYVLDGCRHSMTGRHSFAFDYKCETRENVVPQEQVEGSPQKVLRGTPQSNPFSKIRKIA